MTTYTRGPWTIELGLANKLIDGKGNQIAEFVSHYTADHPNAVLMAAAPDLLEALRNIVEADEGHRLTQGDINQAKAVIVKALAIHS